MDEQEYEEMQFDVICMKRQILRTPDRSNGLEAREKKEYLGIILTIDSCEKRMKIYRLEKEIEELKAQINNLKQ